MQDYDVTLEDINLGNDSSSQGPEVSAPKTSETPEIPKYSYTARGKQIEEPIDMILKRASQGYDYAQLVNQFKKEQESFNSEKQQFMNQHQEIMNKWKPYEDYAQQNPQWADHVRQAYENRHGFNPDQQPGQQYQMPDELRNQFNELVSFKNKFENYLQDQTREKEAIELTNQVESVKKKFPQVNFDFSDPETGKTIEYAVMEHMHLNGLKNFEAAFKDFYFDHLVADAETRAKEEAMKTLQEKNKQGYVAETSYKPSQANRSNYKSKSYYDLALEGLEEGLGRH